MPTYCLTSARLGFRSWADADLEPFAAINADPEVMEYFPSELARAESDALVGRLRRHEELDGYTFWAVDELRTGRLVGMLGLVLQRGMPEIFDLPTHEIGWRFAREYWGRGYATEGARASLEWAFAKTDAERVVAFTTVENTRSERVMRKAGMRRVGAFEHPRLVGHRLGPHVLYEARRAGAAAEPAAGGVDGKSTAR